MSKKSGLISFCPKKSIFIIKRYLEKYIILKSKCILEKVKNKLDIKNLKAFIVIYKKLNESLTYFRLIKYNINKNQNG